MALLGLLDPGVNLHGLEQAAQRDMEKAEPGLERLHALDRGLAMFPGMHTVLQDVVLAEDLFEDLRAVVGNRGKVPGFGLGRAKQGPDDRSL